MLLRRHPRPHRLETCPACESDFVHPVSWEEEGEDHWWMVLRCGGCGHWWDAVVPNETAQEFDAKLHRDQFFMGRAANQLNAEWRNAEADAFAAALEHDLITADDFR